MADSPCTKNRSLKAGGRLNRWSFKAGFTVNVSIFSDSRPWLVVRVSGIKKKKKAIPDSSGGIAQVCRPGSRFHLILPLREASPRTRAARSLNRNIDPRDSVVKDLTASRWSKHRDGSWRSQSTGPRGMRYLRTCSEGSKSTCFGHFC